jgi:hypothetical protein
MNKPLLAGVVMGSAVAAAAGAIASYVFDDDAEVRAVSATSAEQRDCYEHAPDGLSGRSDADNEHCRPALE